MAQASLTFAQMAQIRKARPDSKQVFKDIINEVKRVFGIPYKHRLKVEVDDQRSPDFAVVRRKKTGESYPTEMPQTVAATFYPMMAVEVTKVLAPLAKGNFKGDNLSVDGDFILVKKGKGMGMGKVLATEAFAALQAHLKANPGAGARFNDLAGAGQATPENVQAGENGWHDRVAGVFWIPVR